MDEAAAAVAACLGVINEEEINDQSYVWFNAVLEALGKKLNFESISNLYGNAFAKDASKVVPAANPLVKNGGKQNTGVMGLMGKIKVVEAKSEEMQKAALKKQFGDVSWAEGLI